MRWLLLRKASTAFSALSLCNKLPSSASLAFSTIGSKMTVPAAKNADKPTTTDNAATCNQPSSIATVAAGCFWSVELAFQRMEGVTSTRVGYTNGKVENPTYEAVCTGTTGHAEAVEITFDSSVTSYQTLLEKFWSLHNPTTLNRQKNDIGTQYRSGIYYHSDEQKEIALQTKDAAQAKLSDKIVTEIQPAGTFYTAETYHQQYLEKGGQCASKGCSDNIRCYG